VLVIVEFIHANYFNSISENISLTMPLPKFGTEKEKFWKEVFSSMRRELY